MNLDDGESKQSLYELPPLSRLKIGDGHKLRVATRSYELPPLSRLKIGDGYKLRVATRSYELSPLSRLEIGDGHKLRVGTRSYELPPLSRLKIGDGLKLRVGLRVGTRSYELTPPSRLKHFLAEFWNCTFNIELTSYQTALNRGPIPDVTAVPAIFQAYPTSTIAGS